MPSILLIEDDLTTQIIMNKILNNKGLIATTANSGEEGLSLINEQQFDLVFLDYILPEISGIEVCKLIKQKSPNTFICMMTGMNDQANIEKFTEAGADKVDFKPIRPQQILEIVELVKK